MDKETKPKKETKNKKETQPERDDIEVESQYKKEIQARKDVKKKELSGKELVNWFKFYILPVIAVLILLVILIAGVYPSIQALFGGLDEIDKLEEQSNDLQTRIEKLNTLSSLSARNNAYLELIETIVPTGKTEVVNFQEKIKGIGTDHSLRLLESKAGESIIVPDEDAGVSIGLIEIPSQFTFQGNLTNIKAFLTDLNEGEDFLIIHEMKLANIGSVSTDDWTLDITFVKYQFQDITEEQAKSFSQISESSQPMREVLQFIKDKYGSNDPLLDLGDEPGATGAE